MDGHANIILQHLTGEWADSPATRWSICHGNLIPIRLKAESEGRSSHLRNQTNDSDLVAVLPRRCKSRPPFGRSQLVSCMLAVLCADPAVLRSRLSSFI